jgi:hypothetical protein
VYVFSLSVIWYFHISVATTAGTGSETTGTAVFDFLELKAKTGKKMFFTYQKLSNTYWKQLSFLYFIFLFICLNIFVILV